jgi:hypothetical protein
MKNKAEKTILLKRTCKGIFDVKMKLNEVQRACIVCCELASFAPSFAGIGGIKY